MRRVTIFFLIIPFALEAQVKVIGHRGASFDAPENTMTSVKLAWFKGADAAEVDIYLTADGRVVCIHDSNTKRTAGKDFDIATTNYDILRALDVGSFKGERYKGEQIPPLEDVIASIPPGKDLVVELKARMKVLPALAAVMNDVGVGKNISFICFDLATIAAVKKMFPTRQCSWLCNNTDSFFANIDKVSAAMLDGVSLKSSIIDSDIAATVRKANLNLFAYTVNEEREMLRLISLGIAGITSDRPELLRSVVSVAGRKEGQMADSRDGRVYKTIMIGNQTWFAENLSFRTSSGSFAYNNEEAKVKDYGRLYTMQAATDGCPSGWHLPSTDEWEDLVVNLGGNSLAGGKLKALDRWLMPNTGATNESGFSALPAGSRYHSDSSFNNMGDHGCFWSSSTFGDKEGWFFYVNHDRSSIYRNRLRTTSGFSVRCVQNK